MSAVIDGQGVRWLTPGEAIKRLGQDRPDRYIFKQLVTELSAGAVSGLVRCDGYSVNGIVQNQGGSTVELTAYDLDSLRIYLAAATRHEGDTSEAKLRVEIVDLDVEGGTVRLRVHHQYPELGDEGDPTISSEDCIILFSQIRFDEGQFLATYQNASRARPVERGKRSAPSYPPMTDEQITRWIHNNSDVTNVKTGWTNFRNAHGEQIPKRKVFEDVWRGVHLNRGRGRPKKMP
jgi:hypothetical protein